jgi:hypothetical protein
MYSTSDFRRGLKIELEGTPYSIVEFQHVKPGKGGAFVRTKLKNLATGRVIDRTLRAGEKVEKPDLEEKSMQYLYAEGKQHYFMELETRISWGKAKTTSRKISLSPPCFIRESFSGLKCRCLLCLRWPRPTPGSEGTQPAAEASPQTSRPEQ